MKIVWKWVLASMAMFVLAACGTTNNDLGDGTNNTRSENESLQVVTSFTIIADMAREIGGDAVDVHNLVPTGTDPHEYEPLPEDIKKATDADVLFYNGLNLEGGKNGWFYRMIDSVGQKEENVFNLTNRVEPMYLSGEEGTEEEINPHAFIDPAVGIKMAEDMRDAFVEVDPERTDYYKKRGDEYISRLEGVVQEYEDKIKDIPDENRILVTSERAFQYMASRYGLEEAFIWEIDTEENGSPEQIKSLVGYLEEHKVPVLFIESNVDRRPMETVSNESDIPISEKPIYSDEIGQSGEEVDTYIKFLKYNIKLIHDELSEQY
ncbi:metal ABC transporter solute-binding protein, Zn/Mn family [Oceanobacillus alkalisoli]|uniref:metal ABC transporter solute-binding protein, Zn/Mn family n=1 Tax=Oceanobacillus alkalisoli TaxID=2925113 RepID=UPI001F11B1C6|nr:zinc ABC transporter substrate-binding protein [Oceanobacillus alkalisoli]MCF3944866.1 zinc ABC transporter substrate-binding protein [Oceanobacillus alkalisoli]